MTLQDRFQGAAVELVVVRQDCAELGARLMQTQARITEGQAVMLALLDVIDEPEHEADALKSPMERARKWLVEIGEVEPCRL